MKSVLIGELKIGDIFTYEIKLNGREAFKVLEHKTEKTTIYVSRNTLKKVRKSPNQSVIFLRNEQAKS